MREWQLYLILSLELSDLFSKSYHVSNITDIDDKIIEAAVEQNVEISVITKSSQKYITKTWPNLMF